MTAPLVFLTRDRAFWLAIGATAGTVYTTVFMADGNPILIGAWLALNIAWGLVGSVFVGISVVRQRRARARVVTTAGGSRP